MNCLFLLCLNLKKRLHIIFEEGTPDELSDDCDFNEPNDLPHFPNQQGISHLEFSDQIWVM